MVLSSAYSHEIAPLLAEPVEALTWRIPDLDAGVSVVRHRPLLVERLETFAGRAVRSARSAPVMSRRLARKVAYYCTSRGVVTLAMRLPLLSFTMVLATETMAVLPLCPATTTASTCPFPTRNTGDPLAHGAVTRSSRKDCGVGTS
jgi:hypothetical protein